MFQGQSIYTDLEHFELSLVCSIGTIKSTEPAGMTFHQMWLAILVREDLGATDGFAVENRRLKELAF